MRPVFCLVLRVYVVVIAVVLVAVVVVVGVFVVVVVLPLLLSLLCVPPPAALSPSMAKPLALPLPYTKPPCREEGLASVACSALAVQYHWCCMLLVSLFLFGLRFSLTIAYVLIFVADLFCFCYRVFY